MRELTGANISITFPGAQGLGLVVLEKPAGGYSTTPGGRARNAPHAQLSAHSKGDIQMKRTLLVMAALAGLAAGQAHANTVGIQLSGAGIVGTVRSVLTVAATDSISRVRAFSRSHPSVGTYFGPGLRIVDRPDQPRSVANLAYLTARPDESPGAARLQATSRSPFRPPAGLRSDDDGRPDLRQSLLAQRALHCVRLRRASRRVSSILRGDVHPRRNGSPDVVDLFDNGVTRPD